MSAVPQKLVLYDGQCGMCQGFVRWLIRRDPEARLRFASLESPVAAGLNRPLDPEAIAYVRNGEVYQRSGAVLRILRDLGGIWKLSGIFFLVPRWLRDKVYDLIARNRRRTDSCSWDPSIRNRFLD